MVTQVRTGRDTGRHRGTHSTRSGAVVARRTVQVIAALVSASLLLAMGYYRYTYTSLDKGLHRVGVSGLGAAPTPASGQTGIVHQDGKAQNLLVIGDDSRAGLSEAEVEKLHVGASDATTSTDTILIVHVPADGSKATLISIPRDSYVDIPGFKSNKINAAYADGYTYGTSDQPVDSSSTADQRQAAGLTELISVVKNLTGLEIDHYVIVSFLGFYNIAKAIGGITVNLCHAVDDTGAYNVAHNEGAVGSGFKQTAGVHNLTPVESLQFVRQRHNLVDSKGNQLNDIGREARQRYFLAQAFSKIKSAGTLLSPSELNQLVSAVRGTLTIDPALSLLGLAHQMIDLSSGNILGQTIPTDGDQTIDGQDVLMVDPAKVQKQIEAWLNPTTPSATPSAPAGTSAAPTGAATSGAAANPTASRSSATPAAAGSCIN